MGPFDAGIVIQGHPQGLSPFGNPEMLPRQLEVAGAKVGHFMCVDGFGSPRFNKGNAGFVEFLSQAGTSIAQVQSEKVEAFACENYFETARSHWS